MGTFKILNLNNSDYKNLDQKTFSLTHNLTNHPSLQLDHLMKVVSKHPKDKLLFSAELNKLDNNFDYALDDHKEVDYQKILETIKNTNSSYIAIKNPELNESFKDIYNDINSDLGLIMQELGIGSSPIEPMLWIFIASPNAITPFHIDRFSNFIMQIRGSKELAVYPPRNSTVVPTEITEAYIDWAGKSPLWKEETDHLATKYFFKPGEAAHIPFTSGHYVKNGSDDISITISVFFYTEKSLQWTKAMKLNNRLRKFGIKTNPVDQNKTMDSLKANIFTIENSLENSIRKILRR